MKKILIGLVALGSIPTFAGEQIPSHLLAEYKEAIASKIDTPQCQVTEQNGYFSLNGYGDSYIAGAKGNIFYFSDLIKDAARGEIEKTTDKTIFTFYTVTKSQTIKTTVTSAECCVKEVGTYEVVEYFTKRVNEGTLASPRMVTKYEPTGTSYSCKY